ncbi:di-trans,poly-cis-decaprenylcistransferase [Komagataeibacter oboediens]|uniref:Isoprenyl transferase n=2 Tax=Komagataeibacter oboediens TaxID=65958 RepID=A0ABS5SI32_9PROT|nr:polyprenyl diphosphate synthase [Komagataeibacter oboediens]MBL7234639.1 di-trans,poly-cis-decaprenylcistransferase [Komagataeibacter oboediens]MBT0673949.1 di-trans,poly-cis-decaprenylcistransferase [Komagataeibacter oboediens]MBT0677328.1 di-trans,poly-cis-decaprenylcistransferase [Komagataeibacter oboediens]MBV0888391.1 di-trans,poly-cis-decaprenylcistransferase [Komagataeibacter oboediens]
MSGLDQPASPQPCLPEHVAIIMDGNGRWAGMHNLPLLAGHRAGAEAVQRTVRAATKRGVRWLTLYAFSSENWRRAPGEVADLTSLLRYYLRHKVAELSREGVRLRVIGDLARFPVDIQEEARRAEDTTRDNTRLVLVLALSYGGRADIVQAASRMAQAVARGELQPGDIDETLFASALLTAGMPDPDLVVRTSGECRLSNFLLWQSAYAELVFLDIPWPDFDATHFDTVLDIYSRRERRFGARPA